jgi:hypothetical protein
LKTQRGALKAVRLASDLRFELFAACFGLATIHHEMDFIREQQRAVPLERYLESWAQVKPTLGWPSEVGLTIHLLLFPLSLALIVLPARRALLCLLGVPLLLSVLLSPERIASHTSLLVASSIIAQALVGGELVERWLASRQVDPAPTDWLGWTRRGLGWLLVSTYFFAFYHKLNWGWLSPEGSKASVVLLDVVAPLLKPLVGSDERALELLAFPAIYGTLAVELALAVLLPLRRTALTACLLGIVFHLPMLIHRVDDFPVAVLAFYPLFLSETEAQALLATCLARPQVVRLAAGSLFGVALVLLTANTEPLMRLRDGPTPALEWLADGLAYATLLLVAWVATSLAAILLQRRTAQVAARSRPVGVAQAG